MEEETKKAFLNINGIPYYRSGDYAIETPDGEIDIKGRMDNQIKLRGLRVEIGEIESSIGQYAGILKNLVVIKEINNIEHLCAYFTGDEEIDVNGLKEYLKGRLPQYMVPTVFIQIDEMPENPNGKIDANKLPEPVLEFKYCAPEDELEKLVCDLYSATLGLGRVGAEDNFFEIGGTSLLASKLIIEMFKHGYDVKYEDIFRNQTPRKLARLLRGEVEDDGSDLDIELIQNYDYSEIDELLKVNTLDNFYNGETEDIGNLLLTGATGFLGIHILYEYIKNEDGIIYCMMRKGDYNSCEERLSDLMDYYFNEDLRGLFGSRIVLIEGDISNPEDFNQLENLKIDTFINTAAVVKHYTADDYIFKVNVDGVVNGLIFAKSNNIKYVQISTVSVLSDPNEEASGVRFDEKTFYYNQDLTNKYIYSKFLSERKVLEQALEGADVKIIRVGNLMSRYSDGVFQKNMETNAFLNNIKSIKNLHAIPECINTEEEEMSPVDYVAKAVLALSKTPEECRIFHCVNPHSVYNREIVDALNSFSYDIETVSDDEFDKICRDNMNEDIQGLITSQAIGDEDTNEVQVPEVKYEQSVEIAHDMGVDWPEIDEDYLKKLIGYLNKFGFFNSETGYMGAK